MSVTVRFALGAFVARERGAGSFSAPNSVDELGKRAGLLLSDLVPSKRDEIGEGHLTDLRFLSALDLAFVLELPRLLLSEKPWQSSDGTDSCCDDRSKTG